ncbi:hypothetical protein G6F35_008222 [Rhizopus arrhizus]|nr:hypothetical protein G6F35_008222 [Rhizopus arrhizus]
MPRFHVTLIDVKDSFEYTPGMIKLLVRPEETSSLRVRHDAYVKNGRVVIGYAKKIVGNGKFVVVNNETIPFDYLVICTGSRYKSKLKSFDTSSLYRLSEIATEHKDLKKAKSVLIVGGGLVGCELASEIATHKFPAPYNFKKKITIVEANSTLVKRSSSRRQKNALKYFNSLGIKVVLNEKIVNWSYTDNSTYLGSSGTVYRGYDKVFLATGTSPCSDILESESDIDFESCVDHWSRIRVKPTLQIDHWKYDHIFAGGDVTNVLEEKTGYAATLAGVCIARNICRMEKGKPPLEQGSKGTLPAPLKPLHGIESLGGIGRQQLGSLRKTFSFLNPSWAALKYFDEKEFLHIVQGETKSSVPAAVGRKPKALDLPKDFRAQCCIKHYQGKQIEQHSPPISSGSSVRRRLYDKSSITNLSGSEVISKSDLSSNDTWNCICASENENEDTISLQEQTIEGNWKNRALGPRPQSVSCDHAI